MKKNNLFLFFILVIISQSCFAQAKDSTKSIIDFSGSVSATTNGISIIPTFSLGKPALITSLSLAKGRFSFEPDLRFSMEGKPWGFVFWFRYKIIDHKKFQMRIGAHPAFAYVDETITTNGVEQTHLVAQHYAALELVPNYFFTKNTSIGIYYLYGRGLQNDAIKYTHFLTLNSNFSKVKLSNQFYLGIIPQLYYLSVASEDGFYCSANITLNKEKFPLSFSLFGNQKIKSGITGSKDFIWNATLMYAF